MSVSPGIRLASGKGRMILPLTTRRRAVTFHVMAMLPLILVSPSIFKRGVEFHDRSVSLSVKYEDSSTVDRALLAEIVRRVDGVVLSGGDDLNPGLYAKKLPRAVRQTIEQTPDGGGRDLREIILVDEIFRQRKPLLAICRGHQLLNVALGGKLIADIRRQVPGALNHQRSDKPAGLVHEAALTPGSLLAKITGKQVLGVNSSHHQAVLEPAAPLVAVARSRDGIIEAMELNPAAARRMPFLLSVQFHPERLTERFAGHCAIFRRFIQACIRK
jgi:putative glutamine amidotransferase